MKPSNAPNKLYYGDNLDVLRKYVRDETVDLCYIDPPFNSKRNYNQIYLDTGSEDKAQAQAFVDTWTWDDHANDCISQIMSNKNGVQTKQSIALIQGLESVLSRGSLFAYLVNMTTRIAEIRRTLKQTGSFYLHCDSTASHYLKLICDSIFCSQGGDFRNEIIWKRTSSHNDAKRFSKISDTILYYTKSNKYVWNPQRENYGEAYLNRYYCNVDKNGRKFTYDNLTKPKGSIGYFYELLEVEPPVNGWRMPESRANEWLEEGRIEIPPSGKTPRYKRFADELQGLVIGNIWTDISPVNSQAKEALGYPTQKPIELLERIINTSTNEGDIILDAYCGCGTTVATAQHLKRPWIGIDITYQSISLIIKRLKETYGDRVLQQIKQEGVPRDMNAVKELIKKRDDDRVRKEYEKWAVLTFSDNHAVINEKKGADRGIDGIAYTVTGRDDKGNITSMPVIFSVKSGHVNSSVLRDLYGTVEREKAAAGILITLEDPTRPMLQEAKQAGQFKGDFATFDRLQIVTVKDILENKRMNLPMYAEVVKKAQSDSGAKQTSLFED